MVLYFHHKYLLKSYLRTDNKEIIKKLEIKIKEDCTKDFDKILIFKIIRQHDVCLNIKWREKIILVF